jgi:hypothetical protein
MDTDYLILGAGAMGMAFADVILSEDPSARVIMVDRRADPGGHWNDAYSFVRLHQPAAFYGLNSTSLGRGGADLASGAEVVGYYKAAMDRFLATGRLHFLAMSDYVGDGRVVSLIDDEHVIEVTAHRRVVDSTYMAVQVPAMCPPRYTVEPGVALVPPNGLVRIKKPYDRYVIIGAGKTGIDAVLFLLDNGVSPDRIQWITPNDAWLWDRATVQPGGVLSTFVSQVRSIADSACIDDVFLRLEREGVVCRIDTKITPKKWRCATVDRTELDKLRRIENVVRLGRVKCVGKDRVELEEGTIEASEGSLFVDCTANGLEKRPAKPVFSPGHITLQSVFMCQQTFSAALIARLEVLKAGDETRNNICAPVPHPEMKEDLPAALLTSVQNMLNCNQRLPRWLRNSRLYLGHHDPINRYVADSGKLALLLRRALESSDSMRQKTRRDVSPAGSVGVAQHRG